MSLRRIFRSPYLRLALWVAGLGVMLYLALRDVSLAEVSHTLLRAQMSYVLLALFSVGINVWAKTVRWRVLIGPPGKQLGFIKLMMALLAGQTLNLFLPGRVGELSRAYVIGGLGPGRTFILGTIAVEKVLDMIAYTLLFLLLVLILPLPAWISESGYTFSIIAGFVTLGLVILAGYPRRFERILNRAMAWLPGRIQAQVYPRIQAGMKSLSVIRQRSDLIRLALLAVVVWGSATWTNYLVFQALGMSLPWTAALALLIVLQAGISVPSVPGRIGLFQYLCILTLALFGVDQATSFSYGILLQAIVFIPPTILSAGALWVFGWNGLWGEAHAAPREILE